MVFNALAAAACLFGCLSLQTGLASFQESNSREERRFLKQAQPELSSPEQYALAKLYLSRLALEEKNNADFFMHMRAFEKALPLEHSLNYQKNFLLGLFYYQSGEQASAQNHFEKSLTEGPSEWKNETLAYLLKCQLKQALKSKEQAESLIFNAEHLLKQINSPLLLQQCQEGIELVKQYLTEQQMQGSFQECLQEKSSLRLEGILLAQEGEWEKAKAILGHLEDQPDAQFWLAECEGHLGDEEARQRIIQKIYTETPANPYAPVAYFRAYPLKSYAQGNKEALKHLKALPKKFPNHPYSIQAYYLLGLHQRKDELEAIEYFQKAESLFNLLNSHGKIPAEEKPYYLSLCYQAMLERGKANRSIAEKAVRAKKEIFLDYAQNVFEELVAQSPPMKEANFLQQAHYELAKIYAQKEKNEAADQHFEQVISMGSPLFLVAKSWIEKGRLAKRNAKPAEALSCFLQAEQTGDALSPDEKLEILLEQGECRQKLKEYDQALLVLSRAVNEEAISILRLKAMYQRAEIYLLQGRQELALKQLESLAKKGGEWGKQAKIRLEELYGY